ncbi:hypothetical protein H5410_023280 [Solanum commersonii]|uniref:Uncharacterized protein n=1 Tax=Solanum commersonii TaxID=4109 RepID=A0A9J5ZIR8_SOLCO|nr:hypothetical protein H5410_023280 [Solanum commersonii]
MTHLLQRMTHLLDTCPESEAYPTCKSIVVTEESFVALDELAGATDDSYIVINDSSIGTSLCFFPNLAWYYNMYPTCKSSVTTNESSSAADDSSVAINDLSIGTSFWFNPSLTWYCNMYPTGKLSIAADDLPIRVQIINLLTKITYDVMPNDIGMKIGLIVAVQCEYQLKKKKMMNNQKKMVMNKKKKNDDDDDDEE